MVRYVVLLLVLLAGLVDTSFAQRQINRFTVMNPLNKSLEPNGNAVRWLPGFHGVATFGKYTGLKDTDHEWHHRLGIAGEIVRWNERNSLAGVTQAQFVYDGHNEINFNPRAVFWEEGVVLTRAYEEFDWQLAFHHRCKHDIDNLESGEERTTMNGSLSTRFLLDKWETAFGSWHLTPGMDLYTVTYDHRKPEKFYNEGPDWEKMLGALKANLLWRKVLAKDLRAFVSAYGTATVYSDHPELMDRYLGYEKTRFNGGIFGGIEVSRDADLRIGVRLEHLADTGIPVQTRESTLFSLTAQIMPSGIFY